MLTSTGRTTLAGGLAFMVGGVLFGNWPFFGAGALLILLVAASSLTHVPAIERALSAERVERGGRLVVTLEIEMPRGPGVVEVHQALPEEFELVEGNNLHVLSMGLRRRHETLRFEIRVPKRGEWTLPPVGLQVQHPLGLVETPRLTSGGPAVFHVEPRPRRTRLPRDMRARARRPYPDGDIARMGVATNEFRELREYVPGDPPRRINWKATARRINTGESEVPLVNETEREGKKSIWIIVDGHPKLSYGTNLEDAREHAADAALSLLECYLRRGYQVGLTTARSGDLPILRFGTGESQILKARELLSRLAPTGGPGLVEVLERDGALLHRFKPLVILVTRVAGEDDGLRAAIRRLGGLGHEWGRSIVPGLILDVEPVDAEADQRPPPFRIARRAIDNGRHETMASAMAARVRVSTWRAGADPLEQALLRGRMIP